MSTVSRWATAEKCVFHQHLLLVHCFLGIAELCFAQSGCKSKSVDIVNLIISVMSDIDHGNWNMIYGRFANSNCKHNCICARTCILYTLCVALWSYSALHSPAQPCAQSIQLVALCVNLQQLRICTAQLPHLLYRILFHVH